MFIENPTEHNFAMYRMPESDEVTLVMQNDGEEPASSHSYKWLDGKTGFVMSPFDTDGLRPIVLIRPDHVEHFRIAWEESTTTSRDIYTIEPSESYSRAFSLFKNHLFYGKTGKLVLSRTEAVTTPGEVDPMSIFAEACRRYHHSYVYMVNTVHTGLWIGSTPEILLSGGHCNYTTVALAGTQPAFGDVDLDSVEWNVKNIQEQRLVTQYLLSALKAIKAPYSCGTPRTVRAGDLLHLRTDFKFTLANDDTLGTILKRIHPTPAVCGFPKGPSYKFIKANEGYDREYYSGFLGMLNPDGESSIYVNLRCMKISNGHIRLFAGGGLMSRSNLYDEWMETERKMATMKRLIVSK